jgi:prophage DNA circulation protein
MADMYDASIDGIPLEVEFLADGWQKAVAVYEFPSLDGAETEDMGNRPHHCQIRCYFWDDGKAHNTYLAHFDLIGHLKNHGLVELVHPQYGPLEGRIQEITIRQDDRQRLAEVDLDFIEDISSGPPTPYPNVQAQTELGFFATILSAIQQVQNAINYYTRLITAPIQQIEAGIQACTAALEGVCLSVANPANSIVNAINFGTSIPGTLMQAAVSCCERYAVLYSTMQIGSVQRTSNLTDSLNALPASFPSTVPAEAAAAATRGVVMIAAGYVAYDLGQVYQADQEAWLAQENAEATNPFDALGNYTPVDLEPLMTSDELDKTLYSVRSMIQAAIDDCRNNYALTTSDFADLKATALQLEEHVATVKLQREKTIVVNVPNPMPLHLLCLQYGLDYHAAERIAAINPQIKNPNFCVGPVTIYAK